jgi:hypothetical protein
LFAEEIVGERRGVVGALLRLRLRLLRCARQDALGERLLYEVRRRRRYALDVPRPQNA